MAERKKQPCAREAGSNFEAAFVAAVEEAKGLIEKDKQHHKNAMWRVGELADQLETQYGENTLQAFAEAIGVSFCTVERARSVFRSWKDIPAASPDFADIPWTVLRELQDHPDRAAVVQDNPSLSARKARELTRDAKKQRKVAPASVEEQRRWLNRLYEQARVAKDEAGVTKQHIGLPLRDSMRAAIEPKLLVQLREAGEAWLKLHDFFKGLLDEEQGYTPPDPTSGSREEENGEAALEEATLVEADA